MVKEMKKKKRYYLDTGTLKFEGEYLKDKKVEKEKNMILVVD